ncbi:MAG TPA: ChbG/HpnK family deacetylase [Candidatus Methylomirabilis sp.]|nr:ChbG/HpnK family deacetylase [Candidatus Methylomirabilis sp.]
MARRLIVNADDFNLTEGTTLGILEAHRSGIVTSTSVMVNLPGLERSRDLARACPRLGMGLHLNLTFGPPLLPPGRASSLVDGPGRFLRDPGRLRDAGDPGEIREELAAQVERFQAVFERPPSHLDSHHHIHRHSRIFEAVLDLAAGLCVPVRAFTPEVAARIRARGLPAADGAEGGVGPEPYWTTGRLLAFLDRLPEGVTELMCHPGHADAGLSTSSYSTQREGELHALCDPAVRRALEAAEIRCITYADLGPPGASRP